ncbi:MAG TPA: hypothetical protein VLA67_06535 [Nitrospiraceae bacterium]|nr:hypothetical protein [Nitrospiraceae bacterium]
MLDRWLTSRVCRRIFPVLLAGLSGCTVSHSGFPQVAVQTPSVLTKEASLPFYVSKPEDPYDSDRRKVVEAMAQVGISIVAGAPDALPETSRYCSVQISYAQEVPGAFSPLLLVLPSGEVELYTIDYGVYEHKRTSKDVSISV